MDAMGDDFKRNLEAVFDAGIHLRILRFLYNGKVRYVEPYSLRKPKDQVLLYARETDLEHIKAFSISKMSHCEVVPIGFEPVWKVELR